MSRYATREGLSRASVSQCPVCLSPELEFHREPDEFVRCVKCGAAFSSVVGYDLYWFRRLGIAASDLWRAPGYSEDLRFTAAAAFCGLN